MATDLTRPCANSNAVSPTAQSTSKLQAAIRSPHDAGQTLERINKVLATFYDPNLNDPKTRAGVREEFVRALAGRPQWAVHRAFDDWVRTRDRRPSPAEILILINQHLEPITKILDDRRKVSEAEREAESERLRNRCSARSAEAAMAAAGFTPKRIDQIRSAPMATSFEEAEKFSRHESKSPHWTETVAFNSPEMDLLRQSRDQNEIVRAARQAQAATA